MSENAKLFAPNFIRPCLTQIGSVEIELLMIKVKVNKSENQILMSVIEINKIVAEARIWEASTNSFPPMEKFMKGMVSTSMKSFHLVPMAHPAQER